MSRETKAAIAALLIALGLGAAGGWHFTRAVPVIETAKPAETQADGSVVVGRTGTQPTAKPKQQVPKGAKVERVTAVTVQPTATAEAGKPCPPVTVDMTLIREKDGGRRVIASSPDGQVVAGMDVPVETLPVPEARPWAAGLSLNPLNQTLGAWVERDVGRVRVGIEINQTRPQLLTPPGAEIRVRAGWVF